MLIWQQLVLFLSYCDFMPKPKLKFKTSKTKLLIL